MGYLINVTETYRMSSDEEAKQFLEQLKKDHHFDVLKYSSTKKERKQKGEIVDEWVRFTVTKAFNDEKEPDCPVEISYERIHA